MKIKIIKSSHPLFWYAQRIGEEFQVEGIYKGSDYESAGVYVREGGTYNPRNIVEDGDYTIIFETDKPV